MIRHFFFSFLLVLLYILSVLLLDMSNDQTSTNQLVDDLAHNVAQLEQTVFNQDHLNQSAFQRLESTIASVEESIDGRVVVAIRDDMKRVETSIEDRVITIQCDIKRVEESIGGRITAIQGDIKRVEETTTNRVEAVATSVNSLTTRVDQLAHDIQQDQKHSPPPPSLSPTLLPTPSLIPPQQAFFEPSENEQEFINNSTRSLFLAILLQVLACGATIWLSQLIMYSLYYRFILMISSFFLSICVYFILSSIIHQVEGMSIGRPKRCNYIKAVLLVVKLDLIRRLTVTGIIGTVTIWADHFFEWYTGRKYAGCTYFVVYAALTGVTFLSFVSFCYTMYHASGTDRLSPRRLRIDRNDPDQLLSYRLGSAAESHQSPFDIFWQEQQIPADARFSVLPRFDTFNYSIGVCNAHSIVRLLLLFTIWGAIGFFMYMMVMAGDTQYPGYERCKSRQELEGLIGVIFMSIALIAWHQSTNYFSSFLKKFSDVEKSKCMASV
jgi:hypothetical protein